MSIFNNRHLLKDVDLKKMNTEERLSFFAKVANGEVERDNYEDVFDTARAMSFDEFQWQ